MLRKFTVAQIKAAAAAAADHVADGCDNDGDEQWCRIMFNDQVACIGKADMMVGLPMPPAQAAVNRPFRIAEGQKGLVCKSGVLQ